MKDIESLKLSVNASIKEALEIIDTGAIRIAIVVDKNEKVLGTITDGDIRRGFLKGLDLTSSIKDLYMEAELTPITRLISPFKHVLAFFIESKNNLSKTE